MVALSWLDSVFGLQFPFNVTKIILPDDGPIDLIIIIWPYWIRDWSWVRVQRSRTIRLLPSLVCADSTVKIASFVFLFLFTWVCVLFCVWILGLELGLLLVGMNRRWVDSPVFEFSWLLSLFEDEKTIGNQVGIGRWRRMLCYCMSSFGLLSFPREVESVIEKVYVLLNYVLRSCWNWLWSCEMGLISPKHFWFWCEDVGFSWFCRYPYADFPPPP